MSQMSDEDIIQRYLQTDENAMVGELYNRYARLVFGVSLKYLKNKEESKDLMLSVFEKLLVDLKKYSINNFKAWLYTYTRNECLMALRKKHLTVVEKDVYDMSINVTEEIDDERIQPEERLEMLEVYVDKLTDEQKTCIKLFFIENKSYKQIAYETGLTFKQIKSFIQNGKRNLKMKLTDLGVHE